MKAWPFFLASITFGTLTLLAAGRGGTDPDATSVLIQAVLLGTTVAVAGIWGYEEGRRRHLSTKEDDQ